MCSREAMDEANREGYKPSEEYNEESRDPLFDISVSDSKELWLIQWPYKQDNKVTDTTAAEARRGKDIQGIPWERLSIPCEKYRQTRLELYRNYENIFYQEKVQKKIASQRRKAERIMSSGKIQDL